MVYDKPYQNTKLNPGIMKLTRPGKANKIGP